MGKILSIWFLFRGSHVKERLINGFGCAKMAA